MLSAWKIKLPHDVSANFDSSAVPTYLQVIQAAKRRLKVVRTTEALQRATAGCRTLGDLHRLEAAILAACKTKDIDADILRWASVLWVLFRT